MHRQENGGTTRLSKNTEQLHKDYLDAINPKKRFWRNFSDGIVRGLGIAVGGTIVFAIVGYILSKFLLIPGVEGWINDIKNNVQTIQGYDERGER